MIYISFFAAHLFITHKRFSLVNPVLYFIKQFFLVHMWVILQLDRTILSPFMIFKTECLNDLVLTLSQ